MTLAGPTTWVRLVAAVACFATPPAADPPPDAVAQFRAALDQNAAGGLLIVSVEDPAEEICVVMERVTWPEASVERALRQNRVELLRLDVAEDSPLRRELRAARSPVRIAFAGGLEIDRSSGYSDAGSLAAWITDVSAGRTRLARARARLDRAHASGVGIGGALVGLASAQVAIRQDDLGAQTLVDAWRRYAHEDPTMREQLLTAMASMSRISDRARARITMVRDSAEQTLSGRDPSWDVLCDWLCLNRALGELWKTLEWVDRVIEMPGGRRTMRDRRVWPLVTHAMIAADRWEQLGLIIDQPLVRLKRSFESRSASDGLLGRMGVDEVGLRDAGRREMGREFGIMVTALWAADRRQTASAVLGWGLEAMAGWPEARHAAAEIVVQSKVRPDGIEALVSGDDAESVRLRELILARVGDR